MIEKPRYSITLSGDNIESVFTSPEFVDNMVEICYDPRNSRMEGAFLVAFRYFGPDFFVTRTTWGQERNVAYEYTKDKKKFAEVHKYETDLFELIKELASDPREGLYFWMFHSHPIVNPKDPLRRQNLINLKPSGQDLLVSAQKRQTFLEAGRADTRPIDGTFQMLDENIYLLIYQEKTARSALESDEHTAEIKLSDLLQLSLKAYKVDSLPQPEQAKLAAGMIEELTPFNTALLVYERRNGVYTLTQESRPQLPRFSHTVEIYPLPKKVSP